MFITPDHMSNRGTFQLEVLSMLWQEVQNETELIQTVDNALSFGIPVVIMRADCYR